MIELNSRNSSGGVIHVENIFTRGKSLMPGKRRSREKTTMASRFSGSISNGMMNLSECG
jgi:predicted O-methyltransferase YrrM